MMINQLGKISDIYKWLILEFFNDWQILAKKIKYIFNFKKMTTYICLYDYLKT